MAFWHFPPLNESHFPSAERSVPVRNAAVCKALLKACGSDGCVRDPVRGKVGFIPTSPVPHCQAALLGFASGNAEKEEFYSAEFNLEFLIVRLIVQHWLSPLPSEWSADAPHQSGSFTRADAHACQNVETCDTCLYQQQQMTAGPVKRSSLLSAASEKAAW